MSLSAHVGESAKFPDKISVHTIFIDVECVIPAAGKLSDYNPDIDSTSANGLIGSAFDNLRMLNTYMAISFFPGWGLVIPNTKDKSYNKNHCFLTSSLEYASCVEVYVEYIFALSGELVGWRFFFVACDPAFSFDRALTELFEIEATRMSRMRRASTSLIQTVPKPNERKKFNLPSSQRMWVREYLSPYLGDRFDDNPSTVADLNSATSHPLNSTTNPAKTSRCLTLEYTNEILLRRFGNRIDQDYRNPDKYYATSNNTAPLGDNNFLDNEPPLVIATTVVTKLAFPFNAYPIQHSCLNPKVIMEMNIRDPPESIELAVSMRYGDDSALCDEDQQRNLDTVRRERNRHMRTEIDRLSNVSSNQKLPENPAIEPVRKRFRYDLDQLGTPEEKHGYRCGMYAATARTAVMFNNELNPCGRNILDWHQEKLKVEPRWGTARRCVPTIDPTLSDFGNAMVWAMNFSEEQGGGIANLHKEILMVQIARVMAGDVEKCKLRTHFYFGGPPGSGKSFILTKNEETAIPRTTQWLSNQSEKANSTTEVHNGYQLLIDEAPVVLIGRGVDGTGDASWKSLLSNGTTTTERAQINPDTRECESVITVAQRKMGVLIASNVHHSKIPGAIQDRVYCCEVPEQHRVDSDPILTSLRLESDPKMKAEYEDYIDYWQKIQFVSFHLWTAFETGCFPPVDSDLVLRLSSLTFSNLLKEHGISINKRSQEKIMRMTMAVTIHYAIHHVFMSGEVIPHGTPFCTTQLAQLIPHLTSTREHFYFAFSLMDQIVANPCSIIVLDTLSRINADYINDEDIFSAPTKERAYIDYNYRAITLSTTANGFEVIALVAKMVTARVASSTNFKFSSDSVQDIIAKLLEMSIECRVYGPDGILTNETHRIPVLRYRASALRSGIEISRCYIDNAINNRVNLVEEAIKSTFDRHMPHQRIVTGLSRRYSYKTDVAGNIPYLLHVIDVDKDRSKYPVTILPKDDYVSDLSTFLTTGKRQTAISSKFKHCDYSLDEFYAERWYAQVGARAVAIDRTDREYYGSYPQSIIEAYAREHQAPIRSSGASSKSPHHHTTQAYPMEEEEYW